MGRARQVVARDQYGVAIGRALGSGVDTDGAAGPGLVLDVDLLANRVRKVIADEPCHEIEAPARRKRDHEAYRRGRISLRP
jgi:hypothetical protein